MRCILYVTSYLLLDDLHKTMAIAWGTFPLPIGTAKPEIGCFSQTGSSNHGNRKSKSIVSESSWVLLWGSYLRFLIPQSWWSVESFSAGYVHILLQRQQKFSKVSSAFSDQNIKNRVWRTIQNCILFSSSIFSTSGCHDWNFRFSKNSLFSVSWFRSVVEKYPMQ